MHWVIITYYSHWPKSQQRNSTKHFSGKQARARIFTFKEVSYIPGSQAWDYIQKSKFCSYSNTTTNGITQQFYKNNVLKLLKIKKLRVDELTQVSLQPRTTVEIYWFWYEKLIHYFTALLSGSFLGSPNIILISTDLTCLILKVYLEMDTSLVFIFIGFHRVYLKCGTELNNLKTNYR